MSAIKLLQKLDDLLVVLHPTSAFQNVADVADIVTGEESLANKSMDVAAMGVGGAAGFALGGPLGASIGASFGKTE